MDRKTEIADALAGVGSGCPPPAVFTQTATVGQMDACGAHWPEANFDAGLMERLALQLSRQFGFACARVPYCLTVEAERLGAVLKSGSTDTQPSVDGSPFRTPEGFDPPPADLMDPDEFADGGRCRVVAETAARISSRHPELFVTAGMLDPASVAMQLLGAENVLIGYIMDRRRVEDWVEAMAPFSRAYGARLSEAADNVLVIAAASSDIMDPGMYGSLTEPYLRGTVSSIGESFCTVHSCGNTLPFLEGLVAARPDALSLEASHDPESYLSRVGGRCRMVGAVDPVRTLLSGTPADVVNQARRSAELGFDVVAPECGVPPRTPDGNLAALAGYRVL